MSVTTPSTGQKISDFSAGNVDANSYFIQARNGGTSKVLASQIGQFSNLNLLFNGAGGLDTTNKTIVGAINEVNRKEASDIADVQAAIDEVDAKTGSDIAVSSSDSTSIAEAIGKIGTMGTASWIASASTASATRLTNNVTLTKGVWLITLIVPNSDATIAVGLRSVGWAGIVQFSVLSSLNSFSLPLEVVDDSREFYFDSQQSGTVNFSYLERGGLTAIKIR